MFSDRFETSATNPITINKKNLIMYASYMQDTGSMLSLICKASSLCYTLPKQGWQLKNPGKKPASFF